MATFGQLILAYVDKVFRYLMPSRYVGNEWSKLDTLRIQQVSSNLVLHPVVNQLQDRTIYSQIGVGVYQGEVVAIRQWTFGTTYPQWLVYKLSDQSSDEIPENMSQLLQCSASLLEQYQKQPSLWKNYLRTKDGIELMKWYPELMQCGYKSPLVQGERSNPAIEKQTQLLRERQQLMIEQSQQCLGCPYCQQSNITP